MIDKITTVRRSHVDGTLGRIDESTLLECERRVLVFLGFGR